MRHPYITDIRREAIEEGRKEGIEEGRIEGRQEEKIETARNFLKMGLTLEQVAQGTGLPLEEVEKLAKELKS